MRKFISIVLLIHYFNSVGLASNVKLEKKGYSGIVVAISEKVPESQRLITNLENFFKNASAVLYQATRGEAYFKEITIIAPITWKLEKKKPVIINSENTISMSDIRIDEPHPIYGDDPFTMQPGICGEPGIYMRFSANMFNKTGARNYIARLIIQHWARFRYGVFEEHPDPLNLQVYPALYLKDTKMFPSTCTANIAGWVRSEKQKCTISQGKVVDECMFYAAPKKAGNITASLMSYVCWPTVNYFCDDSPERMHNRFAPSKHNEMCNYRSTWEVVSKHADFSHVSPWPVKAPSPSPPETKFEWKKIEEIKPKYMLVLDVSSSMLDNYRIFILRGATIRFFKDLVPEGSYTGVVYFSDTAMPSFYIADFRETDRATATEKLSKIQVQKATAIGSGLSEAINYVEVSKTATEGVAFILVSDGEENRGTLTEDLYKRLKAKGVIIQSIGFGKQASDRLEFLSTLTGGKTYYYDTTNSTYKAPGAVDMAFLEIMKTQLPVEKHPVLVTYQQEDFTQSETFYKFVINEEIGVNTAISVITDLRTYPSQISVVIHGPNREIYDRRSPEQNTHILAGRVFTRIADARPGEWKVVVRKTKIRFMNLFVMVISHRRPEIKRDPVRIRGWLSSLQVNPSKFSSTDSTKMPLRIFVEVNQGYYPVINATAIATVTTPNGSVYPVTLLDNGRGSDVVKHDGIYSSYFLNFTGNGRYPVSVEVVSRGKAKVRIGTKKMVSVYDMCSRPEGLEEPAKFYFNLSSFNIRKETILNDTEESFPTKDVESFRRFMDTGSFKAFNWTANWKANVTPSRVTDLKVIATKMTGDSLIAKVSWTSPGNHLDQGKPSLIELRGLNDSTELAGNFSNGTLYGFPKGVKSPLTDPPPAGTKVTVNVVVPLTAVTTTTTTEATTTSTTTTTTTTTTTPKPTTTSTTTTTKTTTTSKPTTTSTTTTTTTTTTPKPTTTPTTTTTTTTTTPKPTTTSTTTTTTTRKPTTTSTTTTTTRKPTTPSTTTTTTTRKPTTTSTTTTTTEPTTTEITFSEDDIVYEFNFGLRAYNDEGEASETSNIATGYFSEKWNVKIEIMDVPDPIRDEWPPTVWYLCGFALISILVALAIYECMRCCPSLCGRGSSDKEKDPEPMFNFFGVKI